MIVMDKNIINQLRAASSVKGKQKTWIFDLDNEKIHELFMRIKNGDSAKSIAQHCQLTWEIRPDSSVHSLSQGILKFKKRIAHILASSPTQESTPQVSSRILDDPSSNLETNEQIARNLRLRIERLMREEQELRITYPHLNKDIQTLSTLEKTILQQKEWIRKHPEDDPEEKWFNRKMEVARLLGETYLKTSTQESRDKMIKFCQMFLEEMPKHCITFESQGDGAFKIKDANDNYLEEFPKHGFRAHS